MVLRRRRFVRAAGTVCIASLAGCFGPGGEDTTNRSSSTATVEGVPTSEASTTNREPTNPHATNRTTSRATGRTHTSESGSATPTQMTSETSVAHTRARTSPPGSATNQSTPARTTSAATASTPEIGATGSVTTNGESTSGEPTSGARTASNRTTATLTETTATPNSTTGGQTGTTRGEIAAAVGVGPEGKLVFAPAAVTVSVGETVGWIARSTGHNVCADPDVSGTVSIPTGAEPFASYDDGENPYTALLGIGDQYTHTFETAGEYTYICVPHVNQGMIGRVTVEG